MALSLWMWLTQCVRLRRRRQRENAEVVGVGVVRSTSRCPSGRLAAEQRRIADRFVIAVTNPSSRVGLKAEVAALTGR
jgi:hypothetical protein